MKNFLTKDLTKEGNLNKFTHCYCVDVLIGIREKDMYLTTVRVASGIFLKLSSRSIMNLIPVPMSCVIVVSLIYFRV